MNSVEKSKIKDINLAPSGHDKINWVKNFMPVMNAIEKEYSVSKPFAGIRMVMTGGKDRLFGSGIAGCRGGGYCYSFQSFVHSG